MVNIKDAIAAVEGLFRGLNETKMREVGLEAIRKLPSYKPAQPEPFMLYPSTWFSQVLQFLSPGTPTSSQNPSQLDINSMLQVPFVPRMGGLRVYHEPIYRFWWWMEHAGFAIPVRHEDQGDGGSSRQFPLQWILTTLGLARLASEHPLKPGAMEDLRSKFGTSTPQDPINAALARLDDAHLCFERGLWRPAVVLLGLSYEELIQVTCDRLQVVVPAKPRPSAKTWHDGLRAFVETNPKQWDPETAALNAMNVVGSIRNARNSAAHKASSTWTALEVHELLADGMRAYPKIAGYVPTP
jgi:hypothetical protein